MSDGFGWSELLAAAIGACATGLFGIWDRRSERKQKSEATLVALASEVDAICRLIRHQKCGQAVDKMLQDLRSDKLSFASFSADLNAPYFSVYEALSSDLGYLKPSQAILIVNFYSYCKAFSDSLQAENRADENRSESDSIHTLLSIKELIDSILLVGDQIVQLPKVSLLNFGVKK